MGRGGGGFSGGGHSGGGFGGRNSGGFSGGGRNNNFGNNDFGNNNRNAHGGFYVNTGPRVFYSRRPRRYGGFYGGGHRGGAGVTVAVLIIIISLSVMLSQFSGSPEKYESTKERTPLSGEVNKTDWYRDETGWVSSKNDLVYGLEKFYNKTGIQPFVLFVKYDPSLWLESGEFNASLGDEYLEKFYNDNFTDEAHFIFAYFQCEKDSRDEMNGEFRYLSGYAADTVMDSEAVDILWGYFRTNYDDLSLSMEKMISETFMSTGETIMSRPTNGFDVVRIAVLGISAVAVAVCAVIIVKTLIKRKKEKAKETEDILNTPLESFGDDMSELENKYK